MGTVSPPSRSPGSEGRKTVFGWPAIVLAAVVAALLLTAARGYIRSQEKPPAPVVQVQPTAVVVQVQPTAAPTLTPVPTVDPEKDLKIADSVIKKGLKTPSTYKRISGEELRSGGAPTGGTVHVFRIEYDAQNVYGALIRACGVALFRESGGEIYYFRLDLIAPNPCNAIHPSQAGQKTILDLYEKFAGEAFERLTP